MILQKMMESSSTELARAPWPRSRRSLEQERPLAWPCLWRGQTMATNKATLGKSDPSVRGHGTRISRY